MKQLNTKYSGELDIMNDEIFPGKNLFLEVTQKKTINIHFNASDYGTALGLP